MDDVSKSWVESGCSNSLSPSSFRELPFLPHLHHDVQMGLATFIPDLDDTDWAIGNHLFQVIPGTEHTP